MNDVSSGRSGGEEAPRSGGVVADELRILILEDVATDAELVEHELASAGLTFDAKRVATRDAFRQELRTRLPDLILADFSLPGFDGIEALSIAQQECPEVPFVFVSGAIGEERAIETLKAGATDYVLKQRLTRLEPAVRRALAEAEERSARRRAERALRRSEKQHRALLEINNAIIANLDRQALFDAITQALRNILPFDALALTLYDAKKDALRVAALDGALLAKQFGVGTEIPREGSHLGWILDHRQPLVRGDLTQARRSGTEHELLKAGIHSYVVVPLIAKQNTLGTLNMASRVPDRYTDEDAAFLMEVAYQVAQAIENMLAYEEITELKTRLERENLYLQEEIKTKHNFDEIVGDSPAIAKMLQAIETVAPTDATVLICGETGTGKELVARAVHNLSPKRHKPLVTVNCAALPATLIESELFGHEKGAFTGAVVRKIGRFELADGGTIFLDEIGDLPLELQAKLLRVLQQGEFERVGSSQTSKVDVRVIAATNRELAKAMQEERFRSDLYYRLNVFPIAVPPLRERRDDIPPLVQSFVKRYGAKMGKQIEAIPQRRMAALQAYTWPGNVRELENVIERAVILSQGPKLELGDWRPQPGDVTTGGPGVPTLDELQRQHILEVLELTNWRVSGASGAAELLGLRPTTLEARMKKLGIRRGERLEHPQTAQ